eukprot:2055332-Amphidinium_carterae.1
MQASQKSLSGNAYRISKSVHRQACLYSHVQLPLNGRAPDPLAKVSPMKTTLPTLPHPKPKPN